MVANPELLQIFAKRLKECRDENDLNVRQLGEEVGLSGATISRYERAEINARQTGIKLLAHYFKVNPVWLMGMDAPKYSEDRKLKYKKIPVLGRVAAGKPISAEENIESYETVDSSDDVDFCLKVKGDSMINARIHDGDTVYIRSQPDVENGEIALCMIDDEATIKRIYKVDDCIILRAENPIYPDKVYGKKDFKNIKILGKVKSFKSNI